MDIRVAGPDDVDQVKAVMHLVYKGFGESPPPDEQLTDFLATKLADQRQLVFVVAEEMGQAIGMLTLAFCPTTLRTATFAYLDDFHVLERARGRGVGRAMLGWALDLARERGAVEVKLTASNADPRLSRLYRSMGFKVSSLPLYVLALDTPPGGEAA